MKLTNSEKLILVMLSEVYEKLGIDAVAEIDPKFVRQAIFTDNTWGLEWAYTGIFGDKVEPTPPEVNEVCNYLDMWTFIEVAYDALGKERKDELRKEARLGSDPRFRGFDGNNETEYLGITRFLIEDLHRFENFKGRGLNSHVPSIGRYRRMYEVFEPIRRNLLESTITFEQLVDVLNPSSKP